jgi:hypothetical protein
LCELKHWKDQDIIVVSYPEVTIDNFSLFEKEAHLNVIKALKVLSKN